MRKTNENKLNILLCVASVLLCLTLLSIYMTCGLYAKYVTTTTDNDSARVARFDVSATEASDQPDTIKLTAADSNSNGTYRFTITNNSEVLVKYSVIVSHVPDKVSVVFNNETKISDGTAPLTFDAGELAIGATKDCTLTFLAMDGSTTQTTAVTVQVHEEQVD